MDKDCSMVTVEAQCFNCKRIHDVTDLAYIFDGIWKQNGYYVITCPSCKRVHKDVSYSDKNAAKISNRSKKNGKGVRNRNDSNSSTKFVNDNIPDSRGIEPNSGMPYTLPMDYR